MIREERAEDVQGIHDIHLEAFGSELEAKLVDVLRERRKLTLSLVVENDGELIGHIAFSRATIQQQPALRGLGLAPMAVKPALQRQGIGSMLVTQGLEECKRAGYAFVVVLGHADYYPRFGFRPAKTYGLKCRWGVPDNVFMVMELQPGTLSGVSGLVTYEPEFNEI